MDLDSIFRTLLLLSFTFVSLLLIAVVLIQKGRGGGLASAFGGAGTATAFGAKTGDVLTWATAVIFGVFLLLAITLNLVINNSSNRKALPVVPAQPTSATPTTQAVPSTQP